MTEGFAAKHLSQIIVVGIASAHRSPEARVAVCAAADHVLQLMVVIHLDSQYTTRLRDPDLTPQRCSEELREVAVRVCCGEVGENHALSVLLWYPVHDCTRTLGTN
eukprot:3712954-Rhodomonas_salina.2